jgi:hypothetical protein
MVQEIRDQDLLCMSQPSDVNNVNNLVYAFGDAIVTYNSKSHIIELQLRSI